MVALRRLVDDFSIRTGVTCSFQDGKKWASIPQPMATCLYRIAQEALSNVAKHANATQVEIALCREDGMVSLMVQDNGIGFNSAHCQYERSSLGLVSMKERAHLVKGKVDLESRPGHGTIVRANIPLEDVHV
jgi:signal transduction histidine kinase